jgi:hypothetical protein
MHEQIKIAYLGISITAQRNSYVDPLHQLLVSHWGVQLRPVRAGLGGVGSLACAGLLDYLVLRHSPDICFIECSLSDSRGATPIDWIHSSVSSIVADLRFAGVQPIFLHMPVFCSDGANSIVVDQIYSSIADKYGISSIDVRDIGASSNYSDGIHPNKEGSSEIADVVFSRLPPIAGLLAGPPELIGPVSRIRFLAATLEPPFDSTRESAMAPLMRASHFKFVLPIVQVPVGSQFHFDRAETQFVGTYLIANNDAGVLRFTFANDSIEVQTWDQWCDTPRIQFISLTEIREPCDSLAVELTTLSYAPRNASEGTLLENHCGNQLDLVGVAIRIPGDEVSQFDYVEKSEWWL